MLISDENSFPMIIDSIETPLSIDYFWVLDLLKKDFTLTKLVMLEEFNAPVLELDINGYYVELPADWNILIYSPETSQVDLISVAETTKGGYCALLFDHKKNRMKENSIRAIGYNRNKTINSPSFIKSHMLCVPVGSQYWLPVAPSDSYNRYIKNTLTGDFLP